MMKKLTTALVIVTILSGSQQGCANNKKLNKYLKIGGAVVLGVGATILANQQTKKEDTCKAGKEINTDACKSPKKSSSKPSEPKRPKRSKNKVLKAESAFTSQEAKEIVRLHNQARACVGVGAIKWSGKLAAYAQKWGAHLAATGCNSKHRPRSGPWTQKYGENIFIGSAGYYKATDAAKSWKSEKQYYRGQVLNQSNWYQSGHYTQMVWRNSTQIGCGKVECNGQIIVICNYNPAGNLMGQKPY